MDHDGNVCLIKSDQSTRTHTRTHCLVLCVLVTPRSASRVCFREAISVVCEAVPGAKGAQRRRKV